MFRRKKIDPLPTSSYTAQREKAVYALHNAENFHWILENNSIMFGSYVYGNAEPYIEFIGRQYSRLDREKIGDHIALMKAELGAIDVLVES